MMNVRLVALITATLLWNHVLPAAAADASLVQIRQLYEAANYEQALGLLDRLPAAGTSTTQDVREARRYRVLCLVALDRNDEAERVLDEMLAADPMTPPLPGDLSPRVDTIVQQARQRAARSLVKENYDRGRELYDRKQYAEAADRLHTVVSLIENPTFGLAADPSLADLHVLSDGFWELARALAVNQPVANIAASSRSGQPVAPAAPATPRRSAIQPVPYADPAPFRREPTGPDFVAPRPITQVIPSVDQAMSGYVARREGLIEVEVGADGSVTSATVKVPTVIAYDALLVATAKRDWKYEPATNLGVPVAYRLRVKYVVSSY